jgi:addiction module HigA family antidote
MTLRSSIAIEDRDNQQDANHSPRRDSAGRAPGAAGLSGNALALELKVHALRIDDIVRERRAVTPDTALRLSRYFGTTPAFRMDLQTVFDLQVAARDSGRKIAPEISPRAAASG